MEATTFRYGAERAGYAVVFDSLFRDTVLWHAVLQLDSASRPCPLSQDGGHHVGVYGHCCSVSKWRWAEAPTYW